MKIKKFVKFKNKLDHSIVTPVCCVTQNFFYRLHEAFVQKRIAITANASDESTSTTEAERQFKRLQWQRVMALSSWDQLGNANNSSGLGIIEPSAEQKFMPWELRGQLLDSEAEILRLFELRQRKEFNNYGRMNTSEALFALQV
jgi:hypothetical protein